MLAAAIAVLVIVLFYGAYRIYGGYLARSVFGIRDEEMAPSVEFKDGLDYVPTNKWVLFGHHFASIAGVGPILGPAIAVIWGWLPALVWIVAGSIFMGAVHDFGALVISVRNEGRSVGEVVGRVIGRRARILFMAISAFLISLAMGVFAYTVGSLFASLYPEAVLSVFGLMAVALAVGFLIYRKGAALLPVTIAGIAVMGLLLWAGIKYPVNLYKSFLPAPSRQLVAEAETRSGAPLNAAALKHKLAEDPAPAAAQAILDAAKAENSARSAWVWTLVAYAAVASVLPVWLLLQPRDYINSYLLYFGVAALYVGLFLVRPEMAAPTTNLHQAGVPSLFPLLFVTVACGAISGFHCLVASGTTSKQLGRIKEARFIGYGGMLAEGVLAAVVVLACAAGIGAGGFSEYYGDWTAVERGGMMSKSAQAFIDGGANLFNGLLIPRDWGKALLSLVVVSFAMTTLDSGTRLLRYNLEELARAIRLPVLGNRFVAAAIGAAMLAFFAFVKINTPAGPRPAGIAIWNLFGASNQILAALSLLAVAAYLRLKGKSGWPFLLPFVFLLAVTGAALYLRVKIDLADHNWSLLVTELVTALLAVWLIVEGALFFIRTPAAGQKRAEN